MIEQFNWVSVRFSFHNRFDLVLILCMNRLEAGDLFCNTGWKPAIHFSCLKPAFQLDHRLPKVFETAGINYY
ncbi:MAG: hypothetical protein U9P82_06695 [Bacteroidota bacterium]|nr:hypothetical protein [Bacteroidota bacterium]